MAHGVGVVGISGHEHLVGIASARYVFYEIRYHVALGIAPRVAEAAPVVVERALHVLHLLIHRLFGIPLHAAVERGVDFQSVAVEVEVGAMLAHVVLHRFAEIEGRALIGVFDAEIQLDRLILQGFANLL